MKKMIAILLIAVMAMGLMTGCSDSDKSGYSSMSSYGYNNYDYGSYDPYAYSTVDTSYGYDDGCIGYPFAGQGYDDYDSSFTMECFKCGGDGVCPDCGGSGRNNYTGVLATSGCGLCASSGDCCYCNGTGQSVHY